MLNPYFALLGWNSSEIQNILPICCTIKIFIQKVKVLSQSNMEAWMKVESWYLTFVWASCNDSYRLFPLFITHISIFHFWYSLKNDWFPSTFFSLAPFCFSVNKILMRHSILFDVFLYIHLLGGKITYYGMWSWSKVGSVTLRRPVYTEGQKTICKINIDKK